MPIAYAYTDYGGPDRQQFVEVDKPVPGPEELLVKVHFAGVNPADWKRREGRRRTSERPDEPVPFGLEVAGVVEALGEGASNFSVGDAAFGGVIRGGGFTQFAVLSTEQAAHKPDGVSFADAATLPIAGATAYDGVEQLGLAPGSTLLITGIGGGVGIAAAQIALARGVKVVGTASSAKRNFVESVGATHVAYGADVLNRVRAASDGVDAIFDLVGGDALREVAPLVDDPKAIITAADVATAAELGGQPIARTRNAAVLAVLAALAALVESGTLRPFVTSVFPLDQASAALQLVEDGHATGKVVIEVA